MKVLSNNNVLLPKCKLPNRNFFMIILSYEEAVFSVGLKKMYAV